MYTIAQKDVDVEYYGCKTIHTISFSFDKQAATVEVSFYLVPEYGPYNARISSETDGYHWLQFWLSQPVETNSLVELDFNDQIAVCKSLFAQFGINYKQEDKESALLRYANDLTDAEVSDIVARIIYPRFANRERFFND
jgi:hypothetical protein